MYLATSHATLGSNWPDRRLDARRLDLDLNFCGTDRRKPVTVRHSDGTLVIKPSPDAFRFDDDRLVSGLVPFAA